MSCLSNSLHYGDIGFRWVGIGGDTPPPSISGTASVSAVRDADGGCTITSHFIVGAQNTELNARIRLSAADLTHSTQSERVAVDIGLQGEWLGKKITYPLSEEVEVYRSGKKETITQVINMRCTVERSFIESLEACKSRQSVTPSTAVRPAPAEPLIPARTSN